MSEHSALVSIKTDAEIGKMRIAGRLAADVLQMIEPHIVPGVTTDTLNDICHDYMTKEQGTIPAPLHYLGGGTVPFPKSICTSINHVICHGIPSDRKLKNGDILNIDVTVIKDHYHGDSSKTFFVGDKSTTLTERLVSVTYEAMWRGIRKVKPGNTLGDIGHAVQSFVESNHYSVVEDFCGHGIGKAFHEYPNVMHTGQPGEGLRLMPGMTFTIEPMVNVGKKHTKILPDDWTAVTKDRTLSAQWEHTVLVTETGVEVLTLREDEQAMLATLPTPTAGQSEEVKVDDIEQQDTVSHEALKEGE